MISHARPITLLLSVQEAHLDSMLSTVSVSSAVELACLCVRSRSHLEFCFASIHMSILVAFLVSKELYIANNIYLSPWSHLLQRALVFLRSRRFMLREEPAAYDQGGACSTRWMHMPRSASHIMRSFPSKEADPRSPTCMHPSWQLLFHLSSTRWISSSP